MSMQQMLSYAYVSSLLSDMMVVNTPASGWLSEGVLMRLYGRPLSIIGQLISQTVGGWIPMLFLFSLPMAIVAPLVGVNLSLHPYGFCQPVPMHQPGFCHRYSICLPVNQA